MREWLENKDTDLRERGAGYEFGHGKDQRTSFASALDTREKKRLHVKQPIDYALNILKAHSNSDLHSHTLAHSRQSPPELTSPVGESMLYPTKPDNETASNDELAPSTIYDDLPVSSHPTSLRRPRSAGQDTEPEPSCATTRKHGSKYSLLNLFRKASYTPNTGLSTPEYPNIRSSSASTSSASPSPSLLPFPCQLISVKPQPSQPHPHPIYHL